MLEIFRSGGVIMWPMLVIAIGVVLLCVRSVWELRGDPTTGRGGARQSILFWGVVAVVLGILGSVVGFVQMAQVIMRLGPVDAATVWGGVSVALVSTIFGLLILLFALCAWFLLRYQEMRRVQAVPSLV